MPKTPSKFDKVVKREVCRITTKGTKTFSFLTGECADSQSTYLLALAEKVRVCLGCHSMPYVNNKDADQPAYPRNQISVFVVHFLDSIIPVIAIPETFLLISSNFA